MNYEPSTQPEGNIESSPSPVTNQPAVTPSTVVTSSDTIQPVVAEEQYVAAADFRHIFNFNVGEILDTVGQRIFENVLEGYKDIYGSAHAKCSILSQSIGLKDNQNRKQRRLLRGNPRRLETVWSFQNEIQYSIEFYSNVPNVTLLPLKFQKFISENQDRLTADLNDANLTQIVGSVTLIEVIPLDPTSLPSSLPSNYNPSKSPTPATISVPSSTPTASTTVAPSWTPSRSVTSSVSPIEESSSPAPSVTINPSSSPTSSPPSVAPSAVPSVQPTFPVAQTAEADFRQWFFTENDVPLNGAEKNVFEGVLESYVTRYVLELNYNLINTTCTVIDQSLGKEIVGKITHIRNQIKYTMKYTSKHYNVTLLPNAFHDFISRRKNLDKFMSHLQDNNLTHLYWPESPVKIQSEVSAMSPSPSSVPTSNANAYKYPSLLPSGFPSSSFSPGVGPIPTAKNATPAIPIVVFSTVVFLLLALFLRCVIFKQKCRRTLQTEYHSHESTCSATSGDVRQQTSDTSETQKDEEPLSISSTSLPDQSIQLVDTLPSYDLASSDEETNSASSSSLDPKDNPSSWSITYNQLMNLGMEAHRKFGRRYQRMTMRNIVENMIKPHCREHGVSYALSLNPKGRKMEAFVTHSWDEPFQDFITSIENVYKTTYEKPNLWICGFALDQSNEQTIEKQLDITNPADSPFIVALSDASSFVVVRNSKTDLYSRIWCVCELIYAKKVGLFPKKVEVTGPDTFFRSSTSVIDARASRPEDRERILNVLQQEHDINEIDKIINDFRKFNPSRRWRSFGSLFSSNWDDFRELNNNRNLSL